MTTTLPAYVFSILSGNDVPQTKWSNVNVPPVVGSEVNVTMNALGKGIVIGYEVVSGFLGVHVQFTNPPDWYVKQNKRNNRSNIGLVFGAEIKY